MPDDPLKKFRAQFAPPRAAAPELVVNRPGEKSPYVAFKAKDKVTRLDVRCKDGMAHAVSYSYLPNVSYTWRSHDGLFMTGSGLTVMVKGRALRPVIEAIKSGNCEFIQEFSPEDFIEPEDATAPYIESITVEVIRGAASGATEASA